MYGLILPIILRLARFGATEETGQRNGGFEIDAVRAVLHVANTKFDRHPENGRTVIPHILHVRIPPGRDADCWRVLDGIACRLLEAEIAEFLLCCDCA